MKFEHNVRLLERALRLLERLDAPDAARRGLALKELAQAADISPASAYRLLQTMAAFGYVRQDRKHRYYLFLSSSSGPSRAVRVAGVGPAALPCDRPEAGSVCASHGLAGGRRRRHPWWGCGVFFVRIGVCGLVFRRYSISRTKTEISHSEI